MDSIMRSIIPRIIILNDTLSCDSPLFNRLAVDNASAVPARSMEIGAQ